MRDIKEVEKLMKSADTLYGIHNLDIIREIAKNTMISCTSDIIQLNNYILVLCPNPGNVKTRSEKIKYIRSKTKGTIYADALNVFLEKAADKVLPDINEFADNYEQSTENQLSWFNDNYFVLGLPLWLIIIESEALRNKIGIKGNYDEFDAMLKSMAEHNHDVSNTNDGWITSVFKDFDTKTLLTLSGNVIPVTEEICDIFGARLFYLGAIPVNVKAGSAQMEDESDPENIKVKIDEKDAEKNLRFNLMMMEKSYKVMSIWAYQYHTADIIKAMRALTKEGDMIGIRISDTDINHSLITSFLANFNI